MLVNAFVPHAIPAEDETLRTDVRACIDAQLTGRSLEDRVLSWTASDPAFSRALGAHGLLGLTFPKRYGGRDRSQFARFVVVEELLAAGAPVGAHWIGERQSGPLILHYGTEEQKAFYLPGICRGEMFFSIGMSEPNSGSDLASVRTTAVRDGDGWRINGSKIWTTGGCEAHYMIALVRTSGQPEDRHAGLSQILIDLSLPGVTRRPIEDATGLPHFAEIFFDDVGVGADALIGVEGQGWNQVVAELAFERSGPERYCSTMSLLQACVDYMRAVPDRADGHVLIGRFAARIAVLRSMALSVTASLERKESPVSEAAIVKDLGTGFEQESIALIADALSAHDDVPDDLLRALDRAASLSPAFSLRGGTREIMRGVIARALALR